MAVNKKNIMTRYFFVVLLMSLMGIAVVVKAGFIMFAEQGYWKDVADRFVREGVPPSSPTAATSSRPTAS